MKDYYYTYYISAVNEKVLYSSDWKSFTFIWRKENSNKVIVKDWKISKEYINIESFKYSSDWKSFAFIWKKKIAIKLL